MLVSRRSLLAVVGAGSLAGALIRPAAAAIAAPDAATEAARQGPRGFGAPTAKIVVDEYFSLTCTHCAAFANNTMPEVTKQLIETGKLRFVYHDFPLDQVALMAAMVARSLPAERYEPFTAALFASQDRWAFARDVNSTDELWKMAALAGMDRPTFDSAINDTALRTWILAGQDTAQKTLGIDSTPTFRVNGTQHAGEMDYATFVKMVGA